MLLPGGQSSTSPLPAAVYSTHGVPCLTVSRHAQLSFGPISWLIVGEVFPLSVRGPATALATLTNFGSNFLVCWPGKSAACLKHAAMTSSSYSSFLSAEKCQLWLRA